MPTCVICDKPSQGKREVNLDLCDQCWKEVMEEFEEKRELEVTNCDINSPTSLSGSRRCR